MFESNHSKDVTVDDDGNRQMLFEKFRAVLKVSRTPGQPFATWPDMEDLHGLCDNGNMSAFFKVQGGLKSSNYSVSSVFEKLYFRFLLCAHILSFYSLEFLLHLSGVVR
jgi:hypothetical protein